MRQRGYTLPLVILVLTTLAAAMTLMVVTLTAGAKTTGSMLGRRHTLYACDGIVRGLMVKSRDYFAETPAPTAAGLRDHLCGASTAPLCPPVNSWFPDFVIEEVTTDTGGVDTVEEVPTGPFRGQMARRTDIALSVTAKKASSAQRCRVTQTRSTARSACSSSRSLARCRSSCTIRPRWTSAVACTSTATSKPAAVR